ncbi:MAG: class I SAM-dependent methyltransferase [Bacteroidota bacterium]
MKKPETQMCTACGSTNVMEVVAIENVPAHCNVLWDDRASAINCPKGDIQLNFCNDCGHLYNQVFDEQLMSYDQEYENTLDFSPSFRKYASKLVDRLTTTYDLYGKDIIEVGCGKGDFLKMISSQGNNRGYGFDKSYDPSIENEKPEQVEFIEDFYSEKYAAYPSDLIVSRHVLEHIEYPKPFVSNIKNIAANNGKAKVFYFEVPNILYTLRDFGIWDLIYEHCSYFSATSLTTLFESIGLHVLNVSEGYSGQFLSVEASTVRQPKSHQPYIDIHSISEWVQKFATRFNQKITDWSNKLKQFDAENKKVVVWGGGSKGVSFLNFLKTEGVIDYIVDINPRKEGKYVAGTGQEYIQPNRLKEVRPDVVIVMNPIYKDEIEQSLHEMGLSPEVFTA